MYTRYNVVYSKQAQKVEFGFANMIRPHNKNTKLEQVLSSEQVQSFNNNGYVIVDLQYDMPTLDRAVSDMSKEYEKNTGAKVYPPGTRVQDGWKTSKAVHNIATSQKAYACLQQLYGRKAMAFQTLNFPVGTQQRLHSDTLHFNSLPSGFMAGIWVALEDVNMTNGPLVYYPGSHKMPEYNMQDIGLDIGYENYHAYEDFIEKKIKESQLAPFYGEMKKGQALIWHANLIHGGSKRENPSSTRHSQVTHYYFEDCQYFTPMTSTKSDITWRYPEWIPNRFNTPQTTYSRSRRILGKVKRFIGSRI